MNTFDVRINASRPEPSEFTYKLGGSAIDLTGFAALCRVLFASSPATALDLTSANGGVTLGGVAGTVKVNWPTFIEQLPEIGSYIIHLTPSGGDNVRLVSGTLVVEGRTT